MKNKINLLLPKEKNLVDRFLYFSLNYLRYILVFTQLVVIAVFFYRFKIDQEIIDLKDELQQKKEIVTASQPLLQEAKQVDKKMRTIKQIINDQDTATGMIGYFLGIFPSQMKLDSLRIGDNKLELDGISQDPGIIKNFVEKLNKDSRFKTVAFKSIRRTERGYAFFITLEGFSG